MTSPVASQAALASLALAIAAPAVHAQATAIDSIIVTATRTPQLASEVISDTVTINAEQIANSGAGSITELLQRQRGIEVTRNGGPGAASNVFIRGANGNQSVVLVDGIRIASASTGSASWNGIPLSAIERIEIVYGPLSTLYGADAIGGVIQLFTKKGEGAPAISASVGGGSDRTFAADAAISGGTDQLSYAFSISKERSDGFSATRLPSANFDPDDDGYDRKGAAGQVAYKLAPGHELGAMFLYTDTESDYDSATFDAYSTQTVSNVGVYSRNQFLPFWTMLVQASQSRDKSGSFYDVGPFGSSQIDTTTSTFTFQNDFRIGSDNLQVLYEHRKEEVDGSTAALNRTRHNNAFAANYSLKRGAHLANVGVRHDDNSEYGSKTTGSVGYGYRITSALRAEASFATSFRAPSYNELYYPGYGNKENRPEEGRNTEAGLRYDDGTQKLAAVYYRNKLDNLLLNTSPCPYPGYQYGCAYNINKALLEGLSLSAERQMGKLLLIANADIQDPKDETTGKRLQRRAKRHANFVAEYDMGAARGGVELQLSSDRFDDAGNRNRLPGYGVVNLYATYRFNQDWSALVRWNNVGDRNYELARYYQTGGSNVFAALRYGFK
ncbi:TonB-dependent receptor domain-containing protein [Pseudoduganella albidiflava]|uniref:Outer membrane protein n=1 Tax=Pseudoduganella albidiflava TaxID=321983 RepID=A0A411X448_9BURK|nr:TonB-dependent receptor [Pseudoduganella albidiflava]QBI03704.1 TonB-dependent receptor [Pseudoduganella albidiflava]GGY70333.1 outer membrane protein [Pseudoduganella albidiflava]